MMGKKYDLPKIEEKTEEELNDILSIIRNSTLPENVKDFVIKCIEAALWFPHILQNTKISLQRLRRMIFGKGYKPKPDGNNISKSNNNPNKSNQPPEPPASEQSSVPAAPGQLIPITKKIEDEVEQNRLTEQNNNDKVTEPKLGHGRMPHTVYQDYTEVLLEIVGFKVGDYCPQKCGGKLYPYQPTKPRMIVRIKGQSPAAVYKYIVVQLRCNLCHYLISAEIPESIGTEKYDATFKAWLVIQKFFAAVPLYRQENIQRMLNFPLPDSTQWMLIEQVANPGYIIFDELCNKAANSKGINNDDTKLRIQSVISEIKKDPEMERTGMYTSGFIAEYEGNKIALFFNGTKHSGENLKELLAKRAADKSPIIQMCDALSANLPKDVITIYCNCLSHGFRKFEELVEYFPKPCKTIMTLLGKVYDNDQKTKGMTDDDRLKYHQDNSGPLMQMVYDYINALFAEKLVEPNSALGEALRYMIRHWKKLIKFLSVAGAPLCNNVVERALKVAIRNRKSAMFYRTEYSAHIGGILTSIIYTCHLNNINPLKYLVALQTYSNHVNKNPQQWLPWNYTDALNLLVAQAQEGSANHLGCGPPEVHLAVG